MYQKCSHFFCTYVLITLILEETSDLIMVIHSLETPCLYYCTVLCIDLSCDPDVHKYVPGCYVHMMKSLAGDFWPPFIFWSNSKVLIMINESLYNLAHIFFKNHIPHVSLYKISLKNFRRCSYFGINPEISGTLGTDVKKVILKFYQRT